jgi:hypothetical protein
MICNGERSISLLLYHRQLRVAKHRFHVPVKAVDLSAVCLFAELTAADDKKVSRQKNLNEILFFPRSPI